MSERECAGDFGVTPCILAWQSPFREIIRELHLTGRKVQTTGVAPTDDTFPTTVKLLTSFCIFWIYIYIEQISPAIYLFLPLRVDV